MSSLLASLMSSANALRTYQRALEVTQNNVANASTPGYAAQRLALVAQPFDPLAGLPGGVRPGVLESARDLYSEQAVRGQLAYLGMFEQQVHSLGSIEAALSVATGAGIPGALDRLYQAFSAFSLSPSSLSARQAVLHRAAELAQAFRQTATALEVARTDTDRKIRQTLDQINDLGQRLAAMNAERRRGGAADAGLDAQLHTALEELSALVDFTALYQEDGSVSVLLAGQVPLVIGEHFYALSASYSVPASPPPSYPGAPPPVRIFSASGQEVTPLLGGGKLAALVDVRNRVLPSLLGDPYQPGGLNVLAKAVADRVNGLLTSGWISDGPPPQPGVPLFVYDLTNDTNVAATLDVDPAVTPQMLAAIDPGPPYTSNGIALKLSAIASGLDPADRINGFSFVEFYGDLAARVGRELANARDSRDFRSQTVAQARSLRQQLSGVSLDEEAVRLIEFQRAYQANARLITTLNDLLDTTLGLIR
ncbi:MAG: flagellar hook-associated protein FlgK [Bryobacteraceae bacterium]|nr:flagellar hook-associated protein FlgK [Bryobacteraceae bacterium]